MTTTELRETGKEHIQEIQVSYSYLQKAREDNDSRKATMHEARINEALQLYYDLIKFEGYVAVEVSK